MQPTQPTTQPTKVVKPARTIRPSLQSPSPSSNGHAARVPTGESAKKKGDTSNAAGGATTGGVGGVGVGVGVGVVDRVLAVESAVAEAYVGRSDVVRAMTLSVIARTNMLLLGPPGTAKTAIVRRWASAFAAQPGDVFDVLLTKFTRPAEVFGPIDLAALERGEVRTRTNGFLPSAKVGILDECFKASSAILNALLRIANEREYADNGRMLPTPTRCLIGMSNEFPEDPALLAAFFDRFPLKLMVRPLDNSDFARMLEVVSGPAARSVPSLTDDDLAALDALVDAVDLTGILPLIADVRTMLAAKGVTVSDRRWVQSLRLIRASAVLHSRTKAIRADLAVLAMVCWSSESQIPVIAGILPDVMDPFGRAVNEVLDGLRQDRAEVLAAANVDPVDNAKPSPNITETLITLATTCYTRARNSVARLEMLRDEVESDRDREAVALADQSANEYMAALKDIAGGARVTGGLAALKDVDLTVSIAGRGLVSSSSC